MISRWLSNFVQRHIKKTVWYFHFVAALCFAGCALEEQVKGPDAPAWFIAGVSVELVAVAIGRVSEQLDAAEIKSLRDEVAATKKLTAKLEHQQAPRLLPPDAKEAFAKMGTQKMDIISCTDLQETLVFKSNLISVLESAGWKITPRSASGVSCTGIKVTAFDIEKSDIADGLVREFQSHGIAASTGFPFAVPKSFIVHDPPDWNVATNRGPITLWIGAKQ